MSKLLLNILTLIFISTTGKSQTSFRVQLDPVSENHFVRAVGTPDGGVVVTGLQGYWQVNQAHFVIKLDSVGDIEWSKKYPLITSSIDLHYSFIIPLADGSYYFVLSEGDPVYGSYDKTRVLKLDSLGSIEIVKETDWGTFAYYGNNFYPVEIETGTKSVVILGNYAEYDGFSSTCCRRHYLLKLDTLLNIELSIELPERYTSAKICYLNGVNNGYILSRTLNGKSYITRLDETGMVLWHKSFNYAGISFINQIDTTFYILANSGNQSFLHQIDDNGNTILFRKIIHSDRIQLNDITLTDSTTFLISGLIQMPGLPNWNFNSLLIETDTLFQLLDSKIGNDTLFYLSTNSRYRPSTVFNKYNTGTTPNYIHVENQYFDSTACSFSPISLVANPLVVVDSTISLTTGPYGLVLNPSSVIPANLNVTRTLLCISTGISETDSPGKFNIYPNPAKEKITIEFDSGANEKTELLIYDIAGSQVFHKENISSKEQISTTKFTSGVYIIKVINPKFSETKRLVIY
ncbi:MAG: T9SS type A sorting domain-containing protein [Bacteroidetes bacterium]|nr:T9SS type A sorting domain-containing protein [Bacteroidota bacterium]